MHRVFLALVTSALCCSATRDYAAMIKDAIKTIPRRQIGPKTAIASVEIAHPLQVSSSQFATMYADNSALWGDCTIEEAHINFVRSSLGQVDSARLLLEFSLVPAVKTGVKAETLHAAVREGDVLRVQHIFDRTALTSVRAMAEQPKADGTTPLVAAVMFGNAAIVDLLLEEGADVHAAGPNGAAPIHIAAAMGYVNIIDVLLKHGANIDAPHAFAKSTPLHFAAEMGQVSVVSLLCQRGANVEAMKSTGGRPLHVAADANQSAVVRVLVRDCRADLTAVLLGDTTPLYLAAQNGFTDVVKELLFDNDAREKANFAMPLPPTRVYGSAPLAVGSARALDGEQELAAYFQSLHRRGSDPSAPGFEQANGATALHAAVENGHYGCVELLLAAGVRQQNSMQGATPLLSAVMYNRSKIARLLLARRDVQVNAQLHDGQTALIWAISAGRTALVDQIAAHPSVDFEVATRDGHTALLRACALGRADYVAVLLAAKASVNATAQGLSCWHLAAAHGHMSVLVSTAGVMRHLAFAPHGSKIPLHFAATADIARFFVRNCGVPVDGTVPSASTPLIIALMSSNFEVATVLVTVLAADTNRADEPLRRTPLHCASKLREPSFTALLLDAGVNANARMVNGVTPLHVAAGAGHAPVVRLLLRHGARATNKDHLGRTALRAGVDGNHSLAVAELVAHGSFRASHAHKAIALDGLSPLAAAVVAGHVAIFEVLLKAGASPHYRETDGDSALQLAQRRRRIEMLELVAKISATRDTLANDGADPVENGDDVDDGASSTSPAVVIVSRVKHGDQVYLVDKARGVAYADVPDPSTTPPVAVGSWSPRLGVTLF